LLFAESIPTPGKRSVLVATFIVGLSSLFYLYEFFLRIAPSSMTHELMRDLHVDAASIGVMSGFFFFAYAPMQIPVGLLCDRFGPKRLITLAVLCCGLATLAFAYTHSIYIASLTRFCIGAASAFAFVGPLVLATHWFEEKHLSTVAGIIQAVGCLGAIFAGEPISALINHFGWRSTMLYSGLIGLSLTAFFFIFLKDNIEHSESKPSPTTRPLLPQLKKLCNNPQTWWLSVVAFASWAPMSVFSELWGTSFLMTSYHASKMTAAAATTWIWIGVALGSLLAGWWSTQIESRKTPLITFNCIGLVASLFVIFYHAETWLTLDFFLFMLGLAAGSQPITFGLACEQNHSDMHGAAMGFNNMAVISGGVFLQPLVGYILTMYWDHTMFDGAPVYDTLQYQHAFLLIPACYLLGLFATHFKIQETHCKPFSAAN
jgi:MFS family permease